MSLWFTKLPPITEHDLSIVSFVASHRTGRPNMDKPAGLYFERSIRDEKLHEDGHNLRFVRTRYHC